MSVYLKCIGVDLKVVLAHPEIVRIIPYLITMLGISGFYLLSRKVFGSLFANACLVVYCTTLQLYTFGDQCRGYALEIALSAIHLLLVLRFVQTGMKNLLVWISLTGALMMINLPSTIYYYISLMVLPALALLLHPAKRKLLFNSAEVKVSMAMLVGFIMFVCYFLFVIGLHQLTNNELLYAKENSLLEFLKLPFSIVYRFLDWRVFLVLPLGYSLFMRFRRKWDHQVSFFLLLSFLLPFVLFMIHRPEIMHRIWVPLVPLFSILIVHICYPLIRYFQSNEWKFYMVNLITLLCSFYFLERHLLRNNKSNFITLDLRYQYHLYQFNPGTVLETAMNEARLSHSRIEICEGFKAGIDFYRDYINIDSINLVNKESKTLIVVTDDHACLRGSSNAKMLFSRKTGENTFYTCYIIPRK
jgi:hypothetical protein